MQRRVSQFHYRMIAKHRVNFFLFILIAICIYMYVNICIKLFLFLLYLPSFSYLWLPRLQAHPRQILKETFRINAEIHTCICDICNMTRQNIL